MPSQFSSREIEKENKDRWDIARYLLDDPTLDAVAFEARMENDVEFAQRVSMEVAALSHVASAICQSPLNQPFNATPSELVSRHPYRLRWIAALALAVGLSGIMVGGGMMVPVQTWFLSSSTVAAVPVSETDVANAEIADSWFALQIDGEIAMSDDRDPVSAEESELPGWMLTAMMDGESS